MTVYPPSSHSSPPSSALLLCPSGMTCPWSHGKGGPEPGFEPRPPGLGVSAFAPPPPDRIALGLGFGAYSSYRRAGEIGQNQQFPSLLTLLFLSLSWLASGFKRTHTLEVGMRAAEHVYKPPSSICSFHSPTYYSIRVSLLQG